MSSTCCHSLGLTQCRNLWNWQCSILSQSPTSVLSTRIKSPAGPCRPSIPKRASGTGVAGSILMQAVAGHPPADKGKPELHNDQSSLQGQILATGAAEQWRKYMCPLSCILNSGLQSSGPRAQKTWIVHLHLTSSAWSAALPYPCPISTPTSGNS